MASQTEHPIGNFLPTADLPNYNEILKCTHCGLCLTACPTYRALGVEMESPRGRIYLIKAVANGRLEISPSFAEHMYLCLACRACTTACPAGLRFGNLVEAARGQVEAALPRPWPVSMARRFILRHLFPYPGRLLAVGGLLRFYQRSGLQALARRTGLVRRLPWNLGAAESLLPALPDRFFDPRRAPRVPPRDSARGRVAFFAGCVANIATARTNKATLRVLARNGFEVVVPGGQVCCGAIHLHAGDRETAKELARRNIEAFSIPPEGEGQRGGVSPQEGRSAEEYDAIITNAAGCGVALKEYGELLRDDPAYASRARAFADKVRDVTEFLADLPFAPPSVPNPESSVRVTYQDPCHLAHGQGVRAQPRAILQSIPGLELVEMADSDQCCGSAGVYNVTHHDLSSQLLEEKMAKAAATGAQIIATANVGCMIQLEAGVRRAGLNARVAHVVDLLDEAYASGSPELPDDSLL